MCRLNSSSKEERQPRAGFVVVVAVRSTEADRQSITCLSDPAFHSATGFTTVCMLSRPGKKDQRRIVQTVQLPEQVLREGKACATRMPRKLTG